MYTLTTSNEAASCNSQCELRTVETQGVRKGNCRVLGNRSARGTSVALRFNVGEGQQRTGAQLYCEAQSHLLRAARPPKTTLTLLNTYNNI